MALESFNGLNLRVTDFGEADRYVTALTAEHGRVELYAKGARRTKSPLLRGTEIFTLSSYVAFAKNERKSLNSATAVESFTGLQSDLDILTCAAHLAEVWLTVAQPAIPQPELYELAVYTLYALATAQRDSLEIVRACEVRVLADAGYAIPLEQCGICGCAFPEHEQRTFSFALTAPLCERRACRQKAGSVSTYNGNSTVQLSRGTCRALEWFMQAPIRQLFHFTMNPQILAELNAFVPQYLSDRLERRFHKLDFLLRL